MNNIFENAYFGKAYKTRGGKKAIYLYDYKCWIENDRDYTEYYSDGKWFQDNIEHCLDIVSEWQEEINEEELNKLAMDNSYDLLPADGDIDYVSVVCNAFKSGYRKALKH